MTHSKDLTQNPRYVMDGARMDDLHEIFEDFNKRILSNYNHEMLAELIKKSEVLAFMTKIEEDRAKNKKDDFVEKALTDYIKYLVGERQNAAFTLKREDFAQKHELNKKSLKLPFD